MPENEEHYRDLVENSLDLICTHDLNGVLLTVNLAAARTLGYEPQEIVSRNLREFLSPKSRREFDMFLATIREKSTSAGFLRLQTKDGKTRIWSYTSTLRTDGVQVPFVRGVAHDLTEIWRTQKALRKSEERLRVAAEVGRMYAWEWDPSTGSVLRSAECSGILGLDNVAAGGNAEDYFSLIHPEDRARLWKLATSLTTMCPEYRTEYRRFRPDGTLLWLQESGHASFDKTGKMIRLVGMTADITERKQSDEKLRASEERNRQLVQGSPIAMLVTHGPEQENILINDSFTALFGYSIEDVQSIAQWWTLAYPDEPYRQTVREDWQARVAEAIKNRTEIVPMDARICCKDGSYRYVEFHFASIGETNLVSFVDLTDRKQAQDELAKIGGRLLAAQEQERTRIARELHDDLSQRMALIEIGLDQFAQNTAGLSLKDRRRLQDIAKIAKDVSNNIRDLSHQLHPSKLDMLGLAAAIGGYCREFSEQHQVQVQFVHVDIPTQISKDVTLGLFRIVQEALRNVVKHSGALEAKVELLGRSDRIELCISDSGPGFNPASARRGGGLGLISMRERLRLVGGHLSIESKPSHGTRIRVRVPHTTNTGATGEEKKQAAGA